MNKHVFLPITLLLLFLSLNTFAQRSDKRVYNDDGWWTLGLTGGVAWQDGDICALPGWGAGIDLAKNIYHRPGGLLDLDLRGRLLYTQTYGADHELSYGILDNPALNGTNDPAVNYTAPNGPGFTFMNHKTHLGEASIEAVLTANRLRENTGVILQGFGGLGLAGYQTFTDQLEGYNGDMYDWNEIDTDRRRWDVLNQTGGAYRGIYETPANDYDNAPRVSVMPSLGLGLGYQLTRNFSIGFEHKANWALHDNLEGQQYKRTDNELTDDNDLHHYTSLYLRWRIGDRYKQEPTPSVYNEPVEDKGMGTYPGDAYANAPIITFTKPRKEVSTVNNDRVSVAATIEHIDGRSNIDATFNGKPLTSYTFNTRNDKFAAVLVLEPGTNELEITATNKFGKDIDSRVFIYEQEAVGYTPSTTPTPTPNSNTGMNKSPEVRITRPTSNPYNSEAQIVPLKAEVKNVSSKNDIIFKINGKRTYNFELDGYLGSTITANIPLEVETTNVSIRVSNAYGNDTDTQKIVYCPPNGYTNNNTGNNNGSRPRVRISSPSANPYNSTESTVPVTATVENVNSKNDITFTVNGQRRTNFNYSSYTDKFTANVPLNGERTEVIIRAVNNYGNDSDDLTIVYYPPTVLRPQVTITKPMNDPHTTQSGNERIKATVTNVNSKADINVKINNQPILNFDYSNSRNEVTFTANLNPGTNTVHIKATNSAGSDSDDVVINYNAIERPTVEIIKPGTDPYTSGTATATVIAVVRNVDSKNDITFKVNGKTTNNFNYSALSGKVSSTINLENGNNNVYIKATNEAGSDSDDTVIKYNKPTRPVNTGPGQFNQVKTPTVTITQPHESPFTVSSEQVKILATLTNVNSSRDVSFKMNGKNIRGFQYQPSTGRFEGTVTLKEGNNNIVITGRNGSKTASDNTRLVYEERGQSQGQFGDTYNDNTDGGGNRTSTEEGTKPSRPRLGDLLKGKRNKDSGTKKSETKKSTRTPRGGN